MNKIPPISEVSFTSREGKRSRSKNVDSATFKPQSRSTRLGGATNEGDGDSLERPDKNNFNVSHISAAGSTIYDSQQH